MTRQRNLSLGVVLSFVLSTFTVVLFASPAQADRWSAAGFLQNEATQGCAVEPPGYHQLNDPVPLRNCEHVVKRQWHYDVLFTTSRGYKVVQIKNKFSGLCLGVNYSDVGARIRNTYCVHPTGGITQNTKWRVTISYGLVSFKNRWSRKCIGITRWTRTGRYMAQRWCDALRDGQKWDGSAGPISVS